jgi:hypothetical protein
MTTLIFARTTGQASKAMLGPDDMGLTIRRERRLPMIDRNVSVEAL